MALVQRDLIERMIGQVNAALTRIVAFREAQDWAAVHREVASTSKDVLGPSAALAWVSDPRTAGDLVANGRQLRLWCRLLEHERDVLQATGLEREAAAMDRRIVELLLESWQRDPFWEDEISALLARARGRGGERGLDASRRAALTSWDEAARERQGAASPSRRP